MKPDFGVLIFIGGLALECSFANCTTPFEGDELFLFKTTETQKNDNKRNDKRNDKRNWAGVGRAKHRPTCETISGYDSPC